MHKQSQINSPPAFYCALFVFGLTAAMSVNVAACLCPKCGRNHTSRLWRAHRQYLFRTTQHLRIAALQFYFFLDQIKFKRFLALTSTLAVFTTPCITHATDAATELNQIERQQQKVQPRKIPPKLEGQESIEADRSSEGQTVFFVKGVVVLGNTLIQSEVINSLFTSLIGTNVSIDALRLAMDGVALLYRDKGFVGYATLPKQDITDGLITIEIQEGVFGGAKFLIDSDINYLVDPLIIKNYIEFELPIGQPVNTNKLDRAILIASDLPGILVNQSLQAGENSGETDAGVRMVNEPPYLGALTIDNFGSKPTGYSRTLINASFLSPGGFGDRVDMAVLRTEGVEYGSLAYAMPYGYSGLNLGVNASLMSYEVKNGEASSLEISGLSRTFTINATYPLIRSRIENLNLTSSFDIKHYINKSSFGTESDFVNKQLDVGANYLDLTNWLMGGEFFGSVNFALGHNDYDDSPETFKASKRNEDNDGMHVIFTGNINYIQFVDEDNSVIVKLSGQYGNKNLDSPQKFYLGGEQGVRAYPTSEAGGTHGLLLKIDYRYNLTNDITLSAFYDHGYVKQYKQNHNPATNQPLTLVGNSNSISLRGYGFSLEYLGPLNSTFKTTISDRIGNNPNRTIDNLDTSNAEAPRIMLWASGAINF